MPHSHISPITNATPKRQSSHPKPETITLEVAEAADYQVLFSIRHAVYARELGQHQINEQQLLQDPLDAHNINIIAKIKGKIAGFISITPPQTPFSIDKYFDRDALPFTIDDRTFEVRLLTVTKAYRGSLLSSLLIYAAFRWVESHGGKRIVVIGRRELLSLYQRIGLSATGLKTSSGAVSYELMTGVIVDLAAKVEQFASVVDRLQRSVIWNLAFPLRRPAACFHGGAFFQAIGERFETLERHETIINADVLDAWFPPAPGVLSTLQDHLPWLLRTSPPTGCDGLIDAISEARNIPRNCILPGAGSSDLIFRAFLSFLKKSSRVLILDPTYGEYAHVLEKVLGCRIDRFSLEKALRYAIDPQKLESALADGYDLVVLVNPNSPTGQFVDKHTLVKMLEKAPRKTRIWIDETYVNYLGTDASLEQFATSSENVIVCKSMSKVYALSGARVAYLCAGAHQLEALRAITPPWIVGLPSQVAAVRALEDPSYYEERYAQTRSARTILANGLRTFRWEIDDGAANFLLCHLPVSGPPADTLVRECKVRGLYLRNAQNMGAQFGSHAVRIAVKSAETNNHMIRIIEDSLAASA